MTMVVGGPSLRFRKVIRRGTEKWMTNCASVCAASLTVLSLAMVCGKTEYCGRKAAYNLQIADTDSNTVLYCSNVWESGKPRKHTLRCNSESAYS
jgi:hypothetical protein